MNVALFMKLRTYKKNVNYCLRFRAVFAQRLVLSPWKMAMGEVRMANWQSKIVLSGWHNAIDSRWV